MALMKRVYTDQETVITADNLNDIQDAVIALEDGLFSVDNNVSGEVINITDAYKRGFRSLNIFGKTTQDGTPTPDNPADLVNIGDSGSITVNVTGGNEEKSATVATPNGLPGIPVESGGNYTDANGQQWICDEIDLARGVCIERIRKSTFTGTEKIDVLPLGGNYGYLRYKINLGSRYASNIPNSKVYDGYCTHFGRISADSAYVGKGLNKTALQLEDVSFYADFETVDAFRAFLAEQYAQGKPVEILYILAEPIETPLSAEEIAAYNALRTYRDNTTVSNDAGAYMELEYVMDAKKYLASIGGGGGASARLSSVTISASKWAGENSLYSQVVNISGITENSKVDLLPSVEQLAMFFNKNVSFVTENEDGVVTVYAIGDKPTNDYTMQVQITEVLV